ncbi:hypothetical protein B0O99DRAFT_551233 [Bisporella sp. PMI_857]|nr:hypothetical protein B0O99DRAFT_551233 [Bisporella sp. PMI_857]
MDDLNGLDFTSSSSTSNVKHTPGTGNYYTSLRTGPSPQTSGRNTPLSVQGSGLPKPSPFAPPKSSTPDSFANLVAFGSSKKSTLTLQEQQEKLQAEKRQKEEEKRRQYDAQFGGAWDSLGGGKSATSGAAPRSSTPGSIPPPMAFPNATSLFAATPINASNDADDDLFAAFNKDTKVDNSSFFPPPASTSSRINTPGLGEKRSVDLSKPQAWDQPSTSIGGADFGDDDDPFGLGQMKPVSTPAPIPSVNDDDDFLGDLGKPVEEVRRANPPKKDPPPPVDKPSEPDDPWDKAVAELVDMGFTAEQSRRALTESGSGLDIQAAVGWLLNDAHRKAKQKQDSRDSSRSNGPSNGSKRDLSRDTSRRENNAAWMRDDGRDRSQPRRDDSRSPANGEGDLSKAAAAMGNKLFKTAGSFLSASQKKIQKTVAEFQQDSDTSQPKWMREAAEREYAEKRAQTDSRSKRPQAPEVTDEALMLESGSRPPPRKSANSDARQPSNTRREPSPPRISRPTANSSVPRWQQGASVDPRSRVSKQAIEEQTAQAYVSPARRKKATPQLQPQSPAEPDLLFSPTSQTQPTSRTAPVAKATPRTTPVPSKPSTPIPTRPKAPTRTIPNVSSIALQSSTQHRLAGTNYFKRGDYASAHQSYSSSLSALPQSHPITIILLCNRALTSLKTGVPREAVSDADNVLTLIGLSRGEGECIDLGPGEGGGTKDMKEFWGKALMRKAEALEQMEKWREGGDVWKQCVEANVGGATAIQGRQRCEKALAPKPAPRPVASRPKPKPVARSALSDLGPSADSAAVERLRAANIAAEKADDEKFALADKVDAKIGAWRDGKRDNLRALLGSLDAVMWEGSGWKKISIADLVTTGKVKINYMKAIAKCHPDKLPQDANTEVKLIAATVFSTLNESWDKFKQQNNM